MTVARRLTSGPASKNTSSTPSASPSYPSVINEFDFHPQLWPTANTSGALENRVIAEPVELAHETAKYTDTDERGSRYGCAGVIRGEGSTGNVVVEGDVDGTGGLEVRDGEVRSEGVLADGCGPATRDGVISELRGLLRSRSE